MILVLTQLTTLYSVAQTDIYRYSYRFTDSSVPPKYHRSYEIIVENGTVLFTVDSYGDILYNETLNIQNNQLNDFVTKLKACKLTNISEKKDNGCSGGTGVSFSIQSSVMKQVDGYQYYCANQTYGDLGGNVDDAVRLFKSLIPDFSLKLDGTRK